MNTLADTTNARSRLFHLVALAFSHPVEAFHRVVVDGSYNQALVSTASQARCGGHFAHREARNFTDFEADYIHVFQMGPRGKPTVGLNAGDHKELNQDQDRPQFLLQYSGWYKHFGLKINEGEDANELPDHLVCQLEFMAWLAHLEHARREDPELQRGYQCAQRDFLQRHLQPFLEVLLIRMQQVAEREQVNPFYLSLTARAMEVTDNMLDQFEALLADAGHNTSAGNNEQIAAVNLWG
jgi:DMSO reductase family type II enzyme chaperone